MRIFFSAIFIGIVSVVTVYVVVNNRLTKKIADKINVTLEKENKKIEKIL